MLRLRGEGLALRVPIPPSLCRGLKDAETTTGPAVDETARRDLAPRRDLDIFGHLAGQNSLYAAGSQLLGASVRIGAAVPPFGASASTSDNTDYVHFSDLVWRGVTPYDSLDQVGLGMTVLIVACRRRQGPLRAACVPPADAPSTGAASTSSRWAGPRQGDSQRGDLCLNLNIS